MPILKQTPLSEITEKEQIVKSVDGLTAIKYKVVEELIDLEALRQEKQGIEEMLAIKEPTKEELIEMGKAYHSFYQDRRWMEIRITEINKILSE